MVQKAEFYKEEVIVTLYDGYRLRWKFSSIIRAYYFYRTINWRMQEEQFRRAICR